MFVTSSPGRDTAPREHRCLKTQLGAAFGGGQQPELGAPEQCPTEHPKPRALLLGTAQRWQWLWCPHTHRTRQTNPPSPSAGEGTPSRSPGTLTACPAPPGSTSLPSAQTQAREPGREGGADAQEPQIPPDPLPAQLGSPSSMCSPQTGPAAATTAFPFNSQRLHSRAAGQTHFRRPQLNVGNYGCLHQGTALPRLGRKRHILTPPRLRISEEHPNGTE